MDETHQNINFTRWFKGQPNGGNETEKCAQIKGDQDWSYFDTSCTALSCFYCTQSYLYPLAYILHCLRLHPVKL